MFFEFVLTKMRSELSLPIQYYLVWKNNFLNVNQLVNKVISLEHIGFECLNCGLERKIFRQGFCYDCFYSSPLTGDWIIRPEFSTAHLNIENRNLEYEKKVQLQPHIVYFSLSSHLKVGVTRKTQIPYRWIDQGAVSALPIVEVPNRYLAGITEIALKKYFSDKTNFRKMLQNQIVSIDLKREKNKAKAILPKEIIPYYRDDCDQIIEIKYPVLQYPQKINTLNLQNIPIYKGQLVGIKGQYLLFKDQNVLNLRNFEGYKVRISVV